MHIFVHGWHMHVDAAAETEGRVSMHEQITSVTHGQTDARTIGIPIVPLFASQMAGDNNLMKSLCKAANDIILLTFLSLLGTF
jgi:hypothetical protein